MRIHLSVCVRIWVQVRMCVYSFTAQNGVLIKCLSIKSFKVYFQMKSIICRNSYFLHHLFWPIVLQISIQCSKTNVQDNMFLHISMDSNKFNASCCCPLFFSCKSSVTDDLCHFISFPLFHLWITPSFSQSVSRGGVLTCKGEESRLGRKGGQIKE